MAPIRRLFAVVLIGASVSAVSARKPGAQFPVVWVEFDGGQTSSRCQAAGTLDTLTVVAYNLNVSLVAFDYQLSFPPALLFIDDIVDATLWLGNSMDGLAVVWQQPLNAFDPVVISRPVVVWTQSCDCDYPGPQPLVMSGYQGKAFPQMVRWPDYAASDVVGITSLVCADEPPIAAQSSTWGRIKALYR